MDPLLKTALRAARAAADVHRRWAGRAGAPEARDKGISDFVSQTDLEAQEAALGVIRDRYPEHAILAEEDGGEDRVDGPGGGGEAAPEGDGGGGKAVSEGTGGDGPPAPDLLRDRWPDGPLWVVDPLDGTTNFLHGHPMHCASVGLVLDGRPAVGAVVCAATGESWWAAPGRGAWKDGRRIRASGATEIRSALVGTGFPFKAPHRIAEYQEQFARVLPSTAGIRRGGSAALDLCYLAQGSLDVFWELVLSPWDVCAGLAILGEAGGVHRRIGGGPVGAAPGTVLAGCSPGMMEALAVLVEGEEEARPGRPTRSGSPPGDPPGRPGGRGGTGPGRPRRP